jgi:hypothetical protein
MQVMPVIKWDDTEFLQTKPDPEVGILALSLRALLEEDMDPTKNKCAALCCIASDVKAAKEMLTASVVPLRAGASMWRCHTAT